MKIKLDSYFESKFSKWKQNNFLDYNKINDNLYDLEINYQAVIDSLINIGEVPIPIKTYENLIDQTSSNMFKHQLTRTLAFFMEKYISCNKNLDELPHTIDLENIDLEETRQVILDNYDLESPKKDTISQVYWFNIKEEVITKYIDFKKMQDKAGKFKNYNKK